MTKTYIGVKIVTAWPQDEDSLKIARESTMAVLTGETMRPARPGYAVQYADGYTSWSPKDVFEAAYREVPEDAAASICGALHDGLDIMSQARILGGWQAEHVDDASRQRDIRETAVHLAYKVHERRGIHAQLDASLREIFRTASQIAAYINEGVVTMPEAKEE